MRNFKLNNLCKIDILLSEIQNAFFNSITFPLEAIQFKPKFFYRTI
ncbi:hypothetical protein [Staphylococcus schweitzeri]|nr:hypothetical protein [Staphylococcus schweitzeri]